MFYFAHMHNPSQVFWWVWGGIFVIYEAYALYKGWKYKHNSLEGGSLSAVIWRFNKKSKWIRGFIAAFMVWLSVHLITGKI